MNLYILRHGIAVQHGVRGYANDSDRPLTPKGRERMRAVAHAMTAMELRFDLILSSPYVRARQTAEIVADRFKARAILQNSPHLASDGDPKKLTGDLNRRKPVPENVLLAGHEPSLCEYISTLVFGAVGPSVLLKKGGLCKLSVESLKYGRCATLEWLLTPRQMRLMR